MTNTGTTRMTPAVEATYERRISRRWGNRYHCTTCAAHGIEKGIDATEDGLKKGAAATGKGLEKAGQWIQKKVGQGDE